MITTNAANGHTLLLGREGENLARSMIFDIADWISAYGVGTVSLIAQRSGDTEPYPCTVTVDGSSVTWLVTAADTARQGYGKCELRYAVGDVLVKSETWLTYTADALGTPAPEAPEPQKAWVDKVLEAGQAAVDASVNSPKVGDNGNWFVWDFEAGKYVDTSVAASGGGSGAVSSVNGKAGAVKLTAEDVGAVSVPETASVGQTIVVKAVDEAGKPTELGPVKLTEADKWEFINEVTIADDAEEASNFLFSLDKDGNPFSLRKALFLMYYPQYTGDSTIPNFGFACINGIIYSEESPLIYTGIAIPSSSYPFSSAWEVGLDYSDNLWKESVFGNDTCYIRGAEKNWFLWSYNTRGIVARNYYRFHISEFRRTKTYPITSIGLKAGLIFPGCKFWLYGVKA